MRRTYPTETFIEQVHATAWQAAIDAYGSKTKVPKDVRQQISDRYRAMSALQSCEPSKSYAKHLRELMIPESLIIELVNEYGGDEKVEIDDKGKIKSAGQVKREKSNATSKVIAWLESNPGSIVTVKSLCEACDVAHMTVRKIIKDRIDLLKAGDKRGEFVVRDPKADRKADKA